MSFHTGSCAPSASLFLTPRPAFDAQFWTPDVQAAGRRNDTGAAQTDPTPRLHYCPRLHGSHADFCQSQEFQKYKDEVRADLFFLVDFFRLHRESDANTIADNFNTFHSHRFDDHHYFDTRAELIDSIGKQSLDEFCRMIRHESITVETKLSAIWNLSSGVTMCADGAVSNLAGAARKLAQSTGGIRKKLWALKEETARDVLARAIHEKFGQRKGFNGNEIHYVNTAWNHLAVWYGFEKDPDDTVMAEAQQQSFLRECMARLSATLTPDRLARAIAETCQGKFNSQVPTGSELSRGTWTPEIRQTFEEKLREIGDDFGLASEDELQFDGATQAWKPRQSDIRMNSFLKLEEKDGSAAYAFRSDPSLIALDVLRAMAALKLLQEGDYPQNKGQWMEEDGMHAALFTYGELAWVVRTARPGAYEEPLWACEDVETGLATVPDLLRWQAGQKDKMPSPPAAAVFQAIQAASPEQLMEFPPRWLADRTLSEQFVKRLGKDSGKAYLSANLSHLVASCPEHLRQQTLAEMMQRNMGKVILDVLRLWSADPTEHMNMVCGLLQDKALPALHAALQQDDAKAAVQAWYAPLRESALLAFVAPRLGQVLGPRDECDSAFAQALLSGRAAPVEALYTLLQDLLADSNVQPHIKDQLPELLNATDWSNGAALAFSMASGQDSVVSAFYAGLKALLAAPYFSKSNRAPLVDALPALLVGRKHYSESGLVFALGNGHAGVIHAFHAMLKYLLNDADIAPRIRHAVPDMVTGPDSEAVPGVLHAPRNHDNPAIEAFCAMLTDPDIRQHIGEDRLAYLLGRNAEPAGKALS